MLQSLELFVLLVFFEHFRALFDLSQIVFVIAHSLLQSCKQCLLAKMTSEGAVIGQQLVPCECLLDLSPHLEDFVKETSKFVLHVLNCGFAYVKHAEMLGYLQGLFG